MYNKHEYYLFIYWLHLQYWNIYVSNISAVVSVTYIAKFTVLHIASH
jgi:hypothetical protein